MTRNPQVFYENYEKGMLGPGAESKRVPEDHPEGHKVSFSLLYFDDSVYFLQ